MEVLLECVGSRREVAIKDGESFAEKIEGELGKALGRAVAVRGSETSRSKDSADIYVLQRWSTKWGAFVDIEPSQVVDGDKITAVLQTPTSKVHETSSKAKALCSGLSKPSEADARALATLFPSSCPVKRTSSDVFDPLASCVASAQKRKKKAVRIKPRKVTVVLLSRGTTVLPRFGRRRALKKEGNIRQLQFVRSMSPEHVRRAIVRGFSDKMGQNENNKIIYMQPDGRTHTLARIDKTNFDGGDVIDLAGQASLYIQVENKDDDNTLDMTGQFPDDQPGCSKLIDLTNPTASSSSDCDSQDDLPDASVVCSGTTATNVDYTKWRELRREQDEAFAESLRVDQERIRQADLVKERQEKQRCVRNELLETFSESLQPVDGVTLAFRLPDSTKLQYCFARDASLIVSVL